MTRSQTTKSWYWLKVHIQTLRDSSAALLNIMKPPFMKSSWWVRFTTSSGSSIPANCTPGDFFSSSKCGTWYGREHSRNSWVSIAKIPSWSFSPADQLPHKCALQCLHSWGWWVAMKNYPHQGRTRMAVQQYGPLPLTVPFENQGEITRTNNK